MRSNLDSTHKDFVT